MPAEHACIPIAMTPPNVFHVDVIDAVGKGSNEFDVVDSLVAQVGRIIVETEPLVLFQCPDRS